MPTAADVGTPACWPRVPEASNFGGLNHEQLQQRRRETAPPVLRVRNPDPDAVEGGWEWEAESVDAAAAMQVAADYLGPETSANVLACHWVHGGRADDVVALAEHLLTLHRRVTRPR